MVRKYIKRDFTDHEFTTEYLSDEDEYIRLEIFSFDPEYTQTYLPEQGTLSGENCSKTTWKSWNCFKSEDKINPMEFTLNYEVKESGAYRIDVVYEQNDSMYSSSSDKLYNTGKDLVGWYDFYLSGSKSEHKAEIVTDTNLKNVSKAVKKAIEKSVNRANQSNTSKPVTSSALKFEGENNVIKRKTIFKDLNVGKWKFEFAVPHNCYVMGFIVRKIVRFWGTNNDEPGTNLQFTNAKLTISNMSKPSELEATVGYDDAFDCDLNQSGLYMDYMDECNLYVKNNEGNLVQTFGGYVSTAIPDKDRRTISIHCADRLKDGENKYILDLLQLQEGDGSETEYEDAISFDKYGEVLKYLCKLYEVSLNHNIDGNYVVGESKEEGFVRSFGKKKDIKKITVNNCKVTINKNSVTLRNNSSGKKKQVWKLFSAKKPINISNYDNFHITYGLGSVKTTNKVKETTTVDNSSSIAGAQSFTKCGVSADKKYVMGIGKYSSAKGHGGLSYSNIYKAVFKNKCPHCGKEGVLRWDSARSDTKCIYTENWNGSKRGWHSGIPETQITCTNCDADYDAVTGWEKDSPWKRLTKVGSTVKSTKAEQNKLHNGEMVAVPDSKASVSTKDIFQAIRNSCKGYTHSTGTGTTASYLEKHGVGDCWAWSDKISKELKKYKVNHKIVQYVSSGSDRHRSVLYQNSKGKYVDFPYSQYNFPTNTHNTPGSKSGRVIYSYKKGGRINQASVSGSSTSTETTEVTITNGYDKDKPIQGYFDICYSLQSTTESKKYHVYIDFTQIASSDYAMSGLEPVWVNNSSKELTLTGLVSKIRDYRGENKQIYLRSIDFVAPKIKTTAKTSSDYTEQVDKSTDWYTYDKSTKDNSSCKMILYKLAIDNKTGTQPSGLDSCGKTVNEMINTVLEKTGFIVNMDYHTHRKDDKIEFKVNTNDTPVFTAAEGNNNNILEWGNISYDPANNLYNMSVCVFKSAVTEKYAYVDSRYPESILKYQEQCVLETENDLTGAKQAYWNARHNEKFNPEQTYTFTITVKGFPDVRLKELVEVTANAKKLNTLKECESLTLNYDVKTKPVLQTELGLGELAPDLQVAKNIRIIRENAKGKTTYFDGSASPVTDEDIYEFD